MAPEPAATTPKPPPRPPRRPSTSSPAPVPTPAVPEPAAYSPPAYVEETAEFAAPVAYAAPTAYAATAVAEPPVAPPYDEFADSPEPELDSELPADIDASADEDEQHFTPTRRMTITERIRGLGACGVSMIVHAVAIVALGMYTIKEPIQQLVQEIVSSAIEEREEEIVEFRLEEQIKEVTEESVAVVSSSPAAGVDGGEGIAGVVGSAANSANTQQLDSKVVEEFVAGDVALDSAVGSIPTAKKLIAAVPEGEFKGEARAVIDDYAEAMDRITQEILLMLDKSDVLLIWLMDQSESMEDDREEIRARISNVYQQLGLTDRASGDHLLTSVASYGQHYRVHTNKPTSNRSEIRDAIAEIPNDPSGLEMMCESVGAIINMHREYARGRQMALVMVTDESGDRTTNDNLLEPALAIAKAARCRIYGLGRESVFGYPYVHIRWEHPQTGGVHWIPIDRGPETAFVEQLQTDGFRRRYDSHNSGFGPYEIARLCRDTGGVFFMLPSLETNLVRGEKRRYELEAMRPYKPDLSSRQELFMGRDKSPLQSLLWKVIYDLNPYNKESAKVVEMRLEFGIEPQAFLQQVRQEQTKARLFINYLAEAQKAMEQGKRLREQEAEPRWQANYDLIYAQSIAYQARLYEYGVCLEEFLNDMRKAVQKNEPIAPLFKAPNLRLTNWDITTQRNIRTKEAEPYIERSTQLLKEVIAKHPGTPWAARAEHELQRGFGVKFVPEYHGPPRVVSPGVPIKPVPKL